MKKKQCADNIDHKQRYMAVKKTMPLAPSISLKHNDQFRESGPQQCKILSELKHTCRPTEHMTTKYTADKMVWSAAVVVMGFVGPHGKQYETRKLIIHKVW